MRYLFFLLLLPAFASAQSVGFLRYDSVVIMKQGGTAELVIRGKTRDTLGFLYNTGNGVTQFRRIRQINDTTIVAGRDTIVIKSAASGASGLSVLNGLGAGTQTLANGSTGTAPNWVSVGSAHTLHIPLASANGVTAGLISKSQYDALAKYSQLDSALNLYLLKADTMSLSNRINGRQIAGNYITGLNGDVLATGPGLSNAVLAPTSVTPGTYLNPTIIVDQKGRITSATSGSGGGTGTDNVNAGSGYRLVYPSQLIRTLYAGVGLTIDSTSNSQALTFKPDTSYLATQSDILGLGTVKSVATGYGLSGGTITNTGTLIVDSAALAGKFLRREDSAIYATNTRTDSLVGAVAGKISNIGGLVTPGTGMTRTGLGTAVSPYIFNATNNGTVTNIASGYGLLGGPITSTGTLRVDTAALRVLFGSGGSGGGSQDIASVLGVGNATGNRIEYINGEVSGLQETFKYTPSNFGTAYSGFGRAQGFHGGWARVNGVNGSGRPNVVGTILGYNHTLGGGRIVTDEAGFGFRAETHFETGGQQLFEFHLPEVTASDGTQRRPFSLYINKATAGTAVNFLATDAFNVSNNSAQNVFNFNSSGNFELKGYGTGTQLTLEKAATGEKLQQFIDAGVLYHNTTGLLNQFNSPISVVSTGSGYPIAATANAASAGKSILISGTNPTVSVLDANVNASTGQLMSISNNATDAYAYNILSLQSKSTTGYSQIDLVGDLEGDAGTLRIIREGSGAGIPNKAEIKNVGGDLFLNTTARLGLITGTGLYATNIQTTSIVPDSVLIWDRATVQFLKAKLPSAGSGSNWTTSGGNIYRNSLVGIGPATTPTANLDVNGSTSGTISNFIRNSGSGAARTYISNATGGLDIQVNGAGLATVSSNLGLTLSANSGSTLTLASGSTSLSATGQTITMPGLAGVGNRTVTANASGVLSPSETVYQTYTSTSTNNTAADMTGLMTVSDREAGVFEVTVYASSGTAKYVHKVIVGFVATATTINFDPVTDILPETTTGALAGSSWDLAYDSNGDLKISRTGVSGQNITWRVEVKKYGVIAP